MEKIERLTSITAGEVSYLWMTYQAETLDRLTITFFLQHVKDSDIKGLLEDAKKLADKRIKFIVEVFNEEHYAVPIGFTDSDVNLQAPRLFSDDLYLEYILNSSMIKLRDYSSAMLNAVKLDIQKFYLEVSYGVQHLEMKAKELAKKKGLYGNEARLPVCEKITYVKKDSFLSGLMIKRPLLGIEISQLIFQAKRNALGQAVITAFCQVAESKEIRKFFEKGREIARQHYETFTTILLDDYLPNGAMLWTSEVTDATESPFSDKLMLSFITSLTDASVGSYSVSMSMSPRQDLAAKYTKLIMEVANYSKEGASLLIKNGWMEQPPISANRRDLGK